MDEPPRTWAVVDRRGFAELRLGASRERIESLLGKAGRHFRRTPGSDETEFYVDLGLQITYADGHVSIIEVLEPAQVQLEGISLIGPLCAEVTESLRNAGVDCIEDRDGVSITSLGIELYAADRYSRVEGVTFESVDSGF